MTAERNHVRRMALHLTRISMFVVIVVLIHVQHTQTRARQTDQPFAPVGVEQARRFFPDIQSIAAVAGPNGSREVLDSAGEPLGYLIQTAPRSDDLIGFSGPTNTLIAFSPEDRIVGIEILSSGDTRDHVRRVLEDTTFLNSFTGLSWGETSALADVDGVSGATLTSLAIQESIIRRLSGGRPSLRFPEPVTLADAQAIFETAGSVEQDETLRSLWYVSDERGEQVGTILRTSPSADNIIGYQGPTEARVYFNSAGRIVCISLGKSFDNDPYVSYVREDNYFLTLFDDLKLDELADLDLREAGVEGVSGATMTSMAVAEGLLAAAKQHRQTRSDLARRERSGFTWTLHDAGTGAVVIGGLLIALTRLRGNRILRVVFQLVLIGYLGLANGNLLSQAMFIGWAQSGVPWRNAGGLVLLTVAALAVPITSRRNVYCTHLCPHGAAQYLLMNRLPWRLRLPRWLTRVLSAIPAVLLLWCVIVAMAALPFSLVDIEPFDAWVFRIAGVATLSIAAVGLVTALFVPMAYCRYGCPTGAMLSFLRFNSRSGHWSRRDWFAVLLLAVALGLWLLS